MVRSSFLDHLLRPPASPATRILLLAPHVPEAPAYCCRDFPGDGGYPAYYHRLWSVLSGLGYSVATAGECLALYRVATTTDLVFSLFNRMPVAHPEVFVASTCDYLGLAAIGAPTNVRALAEDKWFTKLVAQAAGLPVAPGAVYGSEAALAVAPAFPGPYFVKHRFGAASEGIAEDSVQDDWAGAQRIVRRLLARGMSALVEAFAPGIDLTVPVLGGARPLALGIVKPGSDKAGGIITEDLKRDDPLGYEMFEAGPAGAGFTADVQALWDAVGAVDYTRLDYRFDPGTGRRIFLEFNICCHIGRSGAICLAARQWGLDQADVLGHVVEYSLRRQGVVPGRAGEVRQWAR